MKHLYVRSIGKLYLVTSQKMSIICAIVSIYLIVKWVKDLNL